MGADVDPPEGPLPGLPAPGADHATLPPPKKKIKVKVEQSEEASSCLAWKQKLDVSSKYERFPTTGQCDISQNPWNGEWHLWHMLSTEEIRLPTPTDFTHKVYEGKEKECFIYLQNCPHYCKNIFQWEVQRLKEYVVPAEPEPLDPGQFIFVPGPKARVKDPATLKKWVKLIEWASNCKYSAVEIPVPGRAEGKGHAIQVAVYQRDKSGLSVMWSLKDVYESAGLKSNDHAWKWYAQSYPSWQNTLRQICGFPGSDLWMVQKASETALSRKKVCSLTDKHANIRCLDFAVMNTFALFFFTHRMSHAPAGRHGRCQDDKDVLKMDRFAEYLLDMILTQFLAQYEDRDEPTILVFLSNCSWIPPAYPSGQELVQVPINMGGKKCTFHL